MSPGLFSGRVVTELNLTWPVHSEVSGGLSCPALDGVVGGRGGDVRVLRVRAVHPLFAARRQ